MTGLLDNDPEDVPGLAAGAEVCFLRWHVISVDFADPEYDLRHPSSTRRQYWDRCLVDQAVVDGTLPVEFIYRVEPDPPLPEDKYPDSGWRIRGDARNATDEELDAREAVYVATGAVLNRDDSWLHLIDEPVGSAFMRDFETGEYLPAFDAEDVTE